jgi:hypothetical protein
MCWATSWPIFLQTHLVTLLEAVMLHVSLGLKELPTLVYAYDNPIKVSAAAESG